MTCRNVSRVVGLAAALTVVLTGGCGNDDASMDDASTGGGDGAAADGGNGGGGNDGSVDDGGEPAPEDAATHAGWRSDTPLPVPTQEIAAAVRDGKIYIAGGIDDENNFLAAVRVYDPIADSWSTAPELPEARHHMALAELDGDLYALGGMRPGSFTAVATAWVLRDGADEWEPIADLPSPRAAGTAGAVGDTIVLAAGVGNGDGCTLFESTYRYHPDDDEWTEGASIPTPREHVAGFVHGGELYVLGGRECSLSSNTDAVEAYDLEGNAWRTLPAMPSTHGGFDAAVLDGVAYAVGGEINARALDSVEALDLSGETWSVLDPVPTPRHGHGVAGIAGRVYVVGGGDTPGFGATDAMESYAP